MNMLLAFIAAFAVAFAIITFFSIRIFQPVERSIDSFIPSGMDKKYLVPKKDELGYVAQQVNEMRRSNQELVGIIEDKDQLYRDIVINNIFIGNNENESIVDTLRSLSLEWIAEECMVIVFEISDSVSALIHEKPYFSDELSRVLLEELRKSYRVKYFPRSSVSPCFIICSGNIASVKEFLNPIVTVVETAFELRISVFIGTVSKGLNELRSSLEIANQLQDEKYSADIKSVYDPSDIRPSTSDLFIYPVNAEQQLLGMIEKNDFKEACRLLDGLFDAVPDSAFDSVEDRDMLALAFANTYQRAVRRFGVPEAFCTGGARIFYRSLKEKRTLKELRDAVAEAFNQLLFEIKDLRLEKAGRLKEDLELYIKENLSRNISLIDISEHFKLTPNYMSSLFKTLLKENFKDYLAQ